MKLKAVILTSVVALMLGACSHKGHHQGHHGHHDCKCAQKEGKHECAGGECSVDKKCDNCGKKEDSSG